jgi:hypothetical protein
MKRLAISWPALFCCCIVPIGCAGEPPGEQEGPVGADELRAFFEGTVAIPEDPERIEALNEAFARQGVRAFGYHRAGVRDREGDRWSPLVQRNGDDLAPADVGVWLGAGDIHASGAFTPCASPCSGRVALDAATMTDEVRELDPTGERLDRVAGALHRLFFEVDAEGQGAPATWTPGSTEGAASLGEGRLEVNPRLLALVLPEIEPMAGDPVTNDPMTGEPIASGPAAGAPDGPLAQGPALTPQNHPRPEEKKSGVSGPDTDSPCDDVCDDLWNDLWSDCDACSVDSPDTGSSSCGNCKCGLAARDSNAQTRALTGAAFVVALAALRRRGRRPPGRRLEDHKPGARPRRRAPWWGFFAAFVFFAAAIAAPAARAQAPDAKQHYDAGVQLLQKKEYKGAITELQASYDLEPTPGKLQKIAQAHRALGNAPRAVDVLEKMVAEHGAKLPARELAAARAQITEMQRSLAYVTVRIDPPTAALFVDGEPLPAGAAASPVAVAAGRRVLSARENGYANAEQVIEVTAGSKDTAVSLTLVPNQGFVSIRAPEPDLLIAIDGNVVGKGTWAGLVAPGRRVVQMYRPGEAGFSTTIDVIAGKKVELPRASPPPVPVFGQPMPPDSSARATGAPFPPIELQRREPPRRGPYVLATAGMLWATSRPYGFTHDGVSPPGFTLGARGGYRLGDIIALELLAEYGRTAAEGLVVQVLEQDINGDGAITDDEAIVDSGAAEYNLQSFRAAFGLKLMTRGKSLRFAGLLGVGAAYDNLTLDHPDVQFMGGVATNLGVYHHEYTGWDPFGLLEIGLEGNVGSVLLGAMAQTYVQYTGGIDGAPYTSNAQAYVGLGVRGGYSAW